VLPEPSKALTAVVFQLRAIPSEEPGMREIWCNEAERYVPRFFDALDAFADCARERCRGRWSAAPPQRRLVATIPHGNAPVDMDSPFGKRRDARRAPRRRDPILHRGWMSRTCMRS
jgi:phosphoribosylformylglycinamidine (FGAM) synthase-like enzyme